jgi:hypothetical protein
MTQLKVGAGGAKGWTTLVKLLREDSIKFVLDLTRIILILLHKLGGSKNLMFPDGSLLKEGLNQWFIDEDRRSLRELFS